MKLSELIKYLLTVQTISGYSCDPEILLLPDSPDGRTSGQEITSIAVAKSDSGFGKTKLYIKGVIRS